MGVQGRRHGPRTWQETATDIFGLTCIVLIILGMAANMVLSLCRLQAMQAQTQEQTQGAGQR